MATIESMLASIIKSSQPAGFDPEAQRRRQIKAKATRQRVLGRQATDRSPFLDPTVISTRQGFPVDPRTLSLEQFMETFVQSVPTPFTPPTTGGGGGGIQLPAPAPGPTGYQPPTIKWKVGDYKAGGGNAPDWWKPFVPSKESDYNQPDAAFTMMMNAMIPHLSPEDQRVVANQLYGIWGDDFSQYRNDKIAYGPGGRSDIKLPPISPEQEILGIEGPVANVDYFRSQQRAVDAVRTLDNLRQSTVGGNRWKLGPGYKYLQNVLGAVSSTGGSTTRANILAQKGKLDPFLAQAKGGELAPFGPIAQMLTNPFFSRFQLDPVTRTESGRYAFGQPSQQFKF